MLKVTINLLEDNKAARKSQRKSVKCMFFYYERMVMVFLESIFLLFVAIFCLAQKDFHVHQGYIVNAINFSSVYYLCHNSQAFSA